MKRIRMIVLLFIICAASLPVSALHASPSIAPPTPTLISPNYSNPFITKDATPTLIFKAPSGNNIEILKDIQIIGSGEANGEHLVPITITTPLSDGLHALTYRSVNIETDEKSPAASISLIVDSNSFDISDIVPMIPSITTPTLMNLLERVQPSQLYNQEVKAELSWFNLVTNSDIDSILTVGVNDDDGYPISNLVESSFNLTINNYSQSAHLELESQIAEGVYKFRLELPSPIYGEINLSVNGVSLPTQHIPDPSTIVSILPQTHHVAVNGSFTLPSTVLATLSDGSTQEVSVDWGTSVVNTTQSGTFDFTGTVANYTPSVELHLVVTNISDYRIILTWDENPWDLDSHLFGSIPEGNFHIYYPENNKKYTVSGVTYAEMERDVTKGYGPETTTIYIKDTLNLGVFRFGVHKYSGTSELSLSNATVTLYKGNELLGTFTVPNGTSEKYWRVFQIVGGELMYGTENHLYQLLPDMNVDFEMRINEVIGLIHRLPEHPTEADITNVEDEVESIKSAYQSIENIESYIVNYDELIPFLPPS